MTSRRPQPTSLRLEMTLLLVAGIAIVLSGLVWLDGQFAGLLWRATWPSVPISAAPGLLLRLPTHLGDPAAAWPMPGRRAIPGPLPLATTALLMPLATGGAIWLRGHKMRRKGRSARPCSSRRRRVPGKFKYAGPSLLGAGMPVPFSAASAGTGWSWTGPRASGAQWATGRDLRSLLVRRAVPGRVVLGKVGRRLLATEERHSALVIGPTQSGKTSGLAIPAILEWDGPVVATSVKSDLAGVTKAWRERCGPTWVFDPSGTAGVSTPASWSPLLEARTWVGAQRMASWLVESTPAKGGLSDSAFWYSAAAKLLAPLLLAASAGGASMAEVVRWTNQGDYSEAAEVLAGAGLTEAELALYACAERDERIRSSVATTLETVLAPFEDPVVSSATRFADIDPGRLLAESGTLFVCGPSYEQHRLAGLFCALIASVVAAAVESAGRRGQPLDHPLLVVLDEAANIAPLQDLDTLAATGAGLGIQLVTICQDLAQFANRYGTERARTIANNHRAKLVLSGVSDLTTLDLVSGLAGEQAVKEYTHTSDLRDGHRTRSSAVAYRRLVSPDSLRRIAPGQGVLIYGHLPAARLSLRPWFEDSSLSARTRI